MPITVTPLRGATWTSPSKESSSSASRTGVRLVANSSVMASRSTREPAGRAPVRIRSLQFAGGAFAHGAGDVDEQPSGNAIKPHI